jgi:hypothetical protein
MAEIVVVVPDPAELSPPGLLITVQAPVEGNPLNATLPVATKQVGWVMVPVTGAVGVNGWGFITIFAEVPEVQPAAFVTVKV